jgi:hypothetical protein
MAIRVRKTYLKITTAQWVDAIKILTGEIKGSRELKMNMQQQLKKQLRWSFLTREEAVKVIDQMNWRISNDDT